MYFALKSESVFSFAKLYICNLSLKTKIDELGCCTICEVRFSSITFLPFISNLFLVKRYLLVGTFFTTLHAEISAAIMINIDIFVEKLFKESEIYFKNTLFYG